MNVDTIQMTRSSARTAFLEYRRAVQARHSAEDMALMRGYRALAEGSAMLDLNAAMRSAGVDASGRPRLAIARADTRWCRLICATSERFTFRGSRAASSRVGVSRSVRDTVTLPEGTLPLPASWNERQALESAALTPTIPPRFRPTGDLGRFHIMWEAEWRARAPVDPFLLRHLGGALYVVLAQWDLTPLEQAVLAGRLSGE